jgi:four helix bundle protein
MATIQRLEDVPAWQKARELVREISETCGECRTGRDFGLKKWLSLAATSSMSNIATGFAWKDNQRFALYLNIAKVWTHAVLSLLKVARNVAYITPEQFQKLYGIAEETGALIGGLASYLCKSSRPQAPESRHRTTD